MGGLGNTLRAGWAWGACLHGLARSEVRRARKGLPPPGPPLVISTLGQRNPHHTPRTSCNTSGPRDLVRAPVRPLTEPGDSGAVPARMTPIHHLIIRR